MVWTSITEPDSTWSEVVQSSSSEILQGSPIGLLLTLTYPEDIVTSITWTPISEPDSTWVAV